MRNSHTIKSGALFHLLFHSPKSTTFFFAVLFSVSDYMDWGEQQKTLLEVTNAVVRLQLRNL